MTEKVYSGPDMVKGQCIAAAFCWLDVITRDLEGLVQSIGMLKDNYDDGTMKEQIDTAWAASVEIHRQCMVMVGAFDSLTNDLSEKWRASAEEE